MNKLHCVLLALVCAVLSTCLLVSSLLGTQWISGCFPLAAIVMEEEIGKFPSVPFSDPQSNDHVRSPSLDQRPLVADQQIMEEKNWLYEKLKLKKLCLNQGFFAYCLKGDGFFELGDYLLCITTRGSKREWTRTERTTVYTVLGTAISSCLSAALLIGSLFISHIQANSRSSELLLRAAAVLNFFSGTVILLGLLPIAVQAVTYSFNTTNFYNDIINGFGAAYFVAMRVDWSIKDGDLTSSQAWARNIVNSMSDLGLDRDFFLALFAGVFLYFGCAALLVRPKSENQEKYGVGFGSIHKLS